MMDKVLRAKIEESGFEALQRLYEIACRDTGQARKVAAFLLGLYNGDRFPFDLTDLRGLDDDLFEDCMAVLRMDARLTRQEVHNYFDRGGQKFEALVTNWHMADHRLMRLALQEQREGQTTRPVRLTAGDFNARLVTYGVCPGYRTLSVTVELTETGTHESAKPIHVDLSFDTASSLDILRELMDASRVAWRGNEGQTKKPLDAKSGEAPPRWVVDGY